MLSIKLSPLLLFIILLVVLVFTTMICKNCMKEGFVSFQYEIDPTSSSNALLMVDIPQYSNDHSVAKLYDNLYFDKINANLVEVDSTNYSNVSGNVDSTYSSISKIYVTTRNNAVHSYTTTYTDGTVVPKDTSESLLNTVSSTNSSWSYVTYGSNTDRYQLFYMPWVDSTYMHIIKLRDYGSSDNSPVHLMSYMFGPGGTMANKNHSSTSFTLSTQNDDNDTNNGKYVYDSYYDPNKTVYQLSKYVKFDTANGNLIIRSSSGITIYNRTGSYSNYTSTGQVSSTSNTITSVDFNAFVYSDDYKYIVLYMPNSTKTVVALIKVDSSDSTKYAIEKVVRFNSNGVDNSSGTDSGSSGNSQSDYYRFWYDYYRYFNSGNNGSDYNFSDDYMLKTQIVPPVCPSCPSCTGSCGGTCTNCGGNGGSGTLTSSGSSMAATPSNISSSVNVNSAGVSAVGTTGSKNIVNNTVDQTGAVVSGTVNTAGNLVNKTVDTTSNLLTSAGSGATDLVKSGVSGAVDLLKSGTGGAVDLVKSGTGGAVDLVKSGVSGTVDLVKSAGTGLKEMAKDSNGNTVYVQGTGSGTGTGTSAGASAGAGVSGRNVSGVDNYSYYGALPTKGSSFMPITADFSAFSK